MTEDTVVKLHRMLAVTVGEMVMLTPIFCIVLCAAFVTPLNWAVPWGLAVFAQVLHWLGLHPRPWPATTVQTERLR